jgi:hypothetical protein
MKYHLQDYLSPITCMNNDVRIKTLRFGLKRGIQGGVTVVVTGAVVFTVVTFPAGVVGV